MAADRVLRRVPPRAVALLAALLLSAVALAGRAPVIFDLGPPAHDAVVTTTLYLGMGAVTSPDNIRALVTPGDEEMPLGVLSTTPWPDGSIMSAEIVLGVVPPPRACWITWGIAPRTKSLPAALPPGAPPLPRVSLGPELDEMRPALDVSVGQVMVRLDSHPEYYYYWYLIPIVAILALLVYRKARLR